MQNRLFRLPKEALLGCEIGSFAIRNRLFGIAKEPISENDVVESGRQRAFRRNEKQKAEYVQEKFVGTKKKPYFCIR